MNMSRSVDCASCLHRKIHEHGNFGCQVNDIARARTLNVSMYRKVLACESDNHHWKSLRGFPWILLTQIYRYHHSWNRCEWWLCWPANRPLAIFTEGALSFCRKIRASVSSENHKRPNFNVLCTRRRWSGIGANGLTRSTIPNQLRIISKVGFSKSPECILNSNRVSIERWYSLYKSRRRSWQSTPTY